MKKRILSKNCLTLCVSGREQKRTFVHTICFGPKNFWSQKEWKPEKNYKNSGFGGTCPKPKMTPFS